MSQPRIGKLIKAPEVRVIDENGVNLNIMRIEDAIALAESKGLDLVEIVPEANPPVCKIIDVGKYKYEIRKKDQEKRKKQSEIEVKEVRIRPTIDKHDLEVKIKQIEAFLNDGSKVRVVVRLRGRDFLHPEFAMGVAQNIYQTFKSKAKIEKEPHNEGPSIVTVLAPLGKK